MANENDLRGNQAYARLHKPQKKNKRSYDNLSSSDGISYDSELNWKGEPRKRKYKIGASRGIKRKKYNTRIEGKKESQIKLLTFAPEFANIYTYTVQKHRNYIYTHIYSIHDNRMYKISKLVSEVLGLRFYKNEFRKYVGRDTVRYPYEEIEVTQERNFVEAEENLVKELSMKMFGYDAGYIWQSMHTLYAYETPKPVQTKSYVVEKQSKNYRLR